MTFAASEFGKELPRRGVRLERFTVSLNVVEGGRVRVQGDVGALASPWRFSSWARDERPFWLVVDPPGVRLGDAARDPMPGVEDSRRGVGAER